MFEYEVYLFECQLNDIDVSGEAFYVWEIQYYLLVNYSNKCNSLILDGEKAILTVRRESTAEQRERYVNEWYRENLKVEIEKALPKWESITGLHPLYLGK